MACKIQTLMSRIIENFKIIFFWWTSVLKRATRQFYKEMKIETVNLIQKSQFQETQIESK